MSLLRIFKSGLYVLLLCLTFGCVEQESAPKSQTGRPDTPTMPDVPEDYIMEERTVTGLVMDAEGNYLSDVSVTTGTSQAITNSNGFFSFHQIGSVNGRGVFRFSKNGYFDVVRSFISDKERIDVVMYRQGSGTATATAYFPASAQKVIKAGDMEVAIPASSVCDEYGNNYSGQVTADLLYMDPNNEHFTDMMPGGDMQAVRTDNSEVTLFSYGMVGVNLTGENGNALQLKDGKEATLTFPIPEGMESDTPKTIPLWYFNENAGLWLECGQATLQGNQYVGNVQHFSYYNLDVPSERGTIRGTVVDCRGIPVQNLKVTVGQTTAYTNYYGEYSVFVPANTQISVWVAPKDYGYYNNIRKHSVSVGGGEAMTLNISLPCLSTISGQVVNDAGSVSVIAKLEYSGRTTVSICPDGKVLMRAPEDYQGSANLSIIEAGTDKTLKTIPLVLEGKDIDLGLISIGSAIEQQGGNFEVFYIDNNNRERYASFDVSTSSIDDGIFIIDDFLMAATGKNENMFLAQLNGFSYNRTDYTNVQLYVQDSEKGFTSEGLLLDMYSSAENAYHLKFSGEGMFYSVNNYYETNASVSKCDIVMPVILKGTKKPHVQDMSELNLPSFTPACIKSITPDMAIVFLESTICNKGCELYYKNLRFADYKQLQKDIQEQTGISIVSESESMNAFGETAYYKNGKYIVLSYDASGIEDMTGSSDLYTLDIAIVDGYRGEVVSYSNQSVSQFSFPKKATSFFRKRRMTK